VAPPGDIPEATVVVELARVKMPIGEVSKLVAGSVIVLGCELGEPMDICMDGRPIGCVEAIGGGGDGLSVRVVRMFSPVATGG